jgi:hypothetical protein
MNIFDIGVNHLPATITVPTQKVLWKIVARNNGSFNLTTGVKLQLAWSTPVIYHRRSDVTDTSGQTFGNGTAAGTFFNIATNLWNIGSLSVGQEKVLILETSLPVGTNLTTALPLTLTKTISVDGFTDTVSENDESVDILLGPCLDIDCGPTAAAADGIGCLCSVANNDTPCNFGITRWEIVPGSGVNTDITKLNFITATGEYTKYLLNPGINGTFKYRMYCSVNGVDVSGPFEATETMTAVYDTNTQNHKAGTKTGAELTLDEVATLQAQPEYALLAEDQIRSYCWNILLNGSNILVGGWAMDCNEKQDTRTFFECSTSPCDNTPNPCPTCPQGQLPTDVITAVNNYPDYTPQEGDAIYVQHPNAYAVYKWNGSQWVKWGCGCISMGSGSIGPTGPQGPAGPQGIPGIDGLDGSTYLQVSDSCSLDLNISGDGSMADPYIISGEVLTGAPVPLYVPGTVALGSSHTVPDVGVLFTETCGAGCTATYTVVGYPDAVFENVVLTGITLTYDIKANAPGGGTHFIEIEKICE